MRPIVMAITGASGAIYAARLLQLLLVHDRTVHLTVSDSGLAVLRQELGLELNPTAFDWRPLLEAGTIGNQRAADAAKQFDRACERASQGGLVYHHCHDFFTPIASGSFLTDGMVICPCSGSTLSGVVSGASQNLIQRAAEVHLKEHRRLILVPRETPLSVFQLENMLRAAQAGAVMLPAMPGWYHGVTSVTDLVDFVVARILDQFGIENQLIHRWSSGN